MYTFLLLWFLTYSHTVYILICKHDVIVFLLYTNGYKKVFVKIYKLNSFLIIYIKDV